MVGRKYLFDYSLGVVNRTGAYMIARDLVDQLPQYFSEIRFWRLMHREPRDPPDGLWRKICARLMMLDITLFEDKPVLEWPDGDTRPERPRVYFDPLYVLRGKLEPNDIVQCLDIGPVSHPDLFSPTVSRLYSLAYDKIRRVGPGMVFISDSTQRAFRERYGDRYRFMQTVAQYVRKGVLEGEAEPVPGVTKPYLLTVGALERRKNYARVMEAYARSGLHQRGVSYVFCGARGLDSGAILEQAQRTPGVTALGYASEKQLRWLYRNAVGFVLPSLLEGFGLPPLEAASQGLVSVVASGGAQEESTDRGAILVDPLDVDAIAAGLVRLVDMPDAERADLLARVRNYATKLSFDAYIKGWDVVLSLNDKYPDSDGWLETELRKIA